MSAAERPDLGDIVRTEGIPVGRVTAVFEHGERVRFEVMSPMDYSMWVSESSITMVRSKEQNLMWRDGWLGNA